MMIQMVDVTVEWNKSGRKKQSDEKSATAGNISVDLSHAKCGFAPGRVLPCLDFVFTTVGYSRRHLPRTPTPVCICVRALTRSLESPYLHFHHDYDALMMGTAGTALGVMGCGVEGDVAITWYH
jgi:hypothetical protein